MLGLGKPAQSRTLAISLAIVRACAGMFIQIGRVRHIDAQPAVYGDRTQPSADGSDDLEKRGERLEAEGQSRPTGGGGNRG